ncbi:hypothetical protein LTR10_001339 [Elasticomyces elasticus]|nr:hypothetical protein LTR10_001339 [Elasticomyces elasticus]
MPATPRMSHARLPQPQPARFMLVSTEFEESNYYYKTRDHFEHVQLELADSIPESTVSPDDALLNHNNRAEHHSPRRPSSCNEHDTAYVEQSHRHYSEEPKDQGKVDVSRSNPPEDIPLLSVDLYQNLQAPAQTRGPRQHISHTAQGPPIDSLADVTLHLSSYPLDEAATDTHSSSASLDQSMMDSESVTYTGASGILVPGVTSDCPNYDRGAGSAAKGLGADMSGGAAPIDDTSSASTSLTVRSVKICYKPNEDLWCRQLMQCGICMSPDLYVRKHELARHMAMHYPGQHPCVHRECPYTGDRAFTRFDTLRKHIREAHGPQ